MLLKTSLLEMKLSSIYFTPPPFPLMKRETTMERTSCQCGTNVGVSQRTVLFFALLVVVLLSRDVERIKHRATGSAEGLLRARRPF